MDSSLAEPNESRACLARAPSLFFPHPSAMFAGIETADRRAREVNENISFPSPA